MEKLEAAYGAGGNVKWCHLCGNQSCKFLRKSNLELPYDPATRVLGIYPRGWKTWPHKALYTNVHSSVTHNSHKMATTQPPSTDEQMENTWSIHTLEYYSAIKRDDVHTVWMNLENMMLSKTRHKRPLIVWFHRHEMSRKRQKVD